MVTWCGFESKKLLHIFYLLVYDWVGGESMDGTDIIDYLNLPSSEFIGESNRFLEERYGKTMFTIDANDLSMKGIVEKKYEVAHWKNTFNWKVFNIQTNYIFLKHQYEQGIPDDDSLSDLGSQLGVHYWFSYHVESILSRIIGAFDLLYHIINVKYELDVKPDLSFRKNVLLKLKDKNMDLYTFMNKIRNNRRNRKANGLRNNFVHNQAPTDLSSPLKKMSNGSVAIGKGEYTSSKDILVVVDSVLDYLQETKIQFEKIL